MDHFPLVLDHIISSAQPLATAKGNEKLIGDQTMNN